MLFVTWLKITLQNQSWALPY